MTKLLNGAIRPSTLIPVQGTKVDIKFKNETLETIAAIGALPLIYISQVLPDQKGIIHFADIEETDEIAVDDGNPNSLDRFYSRYLVIPLSDEDLMKFKTGAETMLEIYKRNKIYLIEGVFDCLEDVEVWTDLGEETLKEYLPEPNIFATQLTNYN